MEQGFIDILKRLIPKQGKKAPLNAAYRQGVEYYNKKDYENAIKSFTDAINSGCKEIFEAYTYRGFIYLETGRDTKALSDYILATKITPNNINAYLSKGAALGMMDMYDAAIDDAKQVLSLDPDNQIAKEILQLARAGQATDAFLNLR